VAEDQLQEFGKVPVVPFCQENGHRVTGTELLEEPEVLD